MEETMRQEARRAPEKCFFFGKKVFEKEGKKVRFF